MPRQTGLGIHECRLLSTEHTHPLGRYNISTTLLTIKTTIYNNEINNITLIIILYINPSRAADWEAILNGK